MKWNWIIIQADDLSWHRTLDLRTLIFFFFFSYMRIDQSWCRLRDVFEHDLVVDIIYVSIVFNLAVDSWWTTVKKKKKSNNKHLHWFCVWFWNDYKNLSWTTPWSSSSSWSSSMSSSWSLSMSSSWSLSSSLQLFIRDVLHIQSTVLKWFAAQQQRSHNVCLQYYGYFQERKQKVIYNTDSLAHRLLPETS